MPSHAECKAAAAALKPPEPKNFITANAVENILAVPKRQPDAVDWLKKPNFGAVPPYLQKIKKEINDEYEYIRSMQQSQMAEGPPGMRLLPEDERRKLIDELKQKWDSVNVGYQQGSVLSLASLDTIGKVKRCAAPPRGSLASPLRCNCGGPPTCVRARCDHSEERVGRRATAGGSVPARRMVFLKGTRRPKPGGWPPRSSRAACVPPPLSGSPPFGAAGRRCTRRSWRRLRRT